MNRQAIENVLSRSLKQSFRLEEKRNALYQVFVPIYHEDGDMMDIFIMSREDGSVIICDCGKTLMRLSYSYDMNTPRKEKILTDILKSNGASIKDGNIFLPSSPDLLCENVMQLSQTIAQVDAMRYQKKSSMPSFFYDDVDAFIDERLQAFHPEKNISPLENRDELIVDYRLTIREQPFFLFTILGNTKALSSVISILTFQKEKLPFTSIAVHSNYSDLSLSTQKKIMNAADKQFFDLASFCGNAYEFFARIAG